MALEQCGHALQQILITSARALQKVQAPRAIHLQCSFYERIDLLIALLVHEIRSILPGFPDRLSSAKSHALAAFQSRTTVSPETFSAAAVSSTLIPPK